MLPGLDADAQAAKARAKADANTDPSCQSPARIDECYLTKGERPVRHPCTDSADEGA